MKTKRTVEYVVMYYLRNYVKSWRNFNTYRKIGPARRAKKSIQSQGYKVRIIRHEEKEVK